jgi:hypothetical protein
MVLASLAALAQPAEARGQALPMLVGGAAGLLGGYVVTTGIFVAESRTGRFIYSLEDLATSRLEYLPMPVGLAGGIAMAAKDPALLRHALGGAGLGLTGGVALGWLVGGLVWEGPEGEWAGAILGGALGLLVGGSIGAGRWSSSDEGSAGLPATPSRTAVK